MTEAESEMEQKLMDSIMAEGDSIFAAANSIAEDAFSAEDMLRAATYYEKKRMSGRKFYNENKEKCLEYTRRRRERAREARKKELEERLARGEVIEQPRKKKRSADESARKRFTDEEIKEKTAARQKAYRLRRKQAYLAWEGRAQVNSAEENKSQECEQVNSAEETKSEV